MKETGSFIIGLLLACGSMGNYVIISCWRSKNLLVGLGVNRRDKVSLPSISLLF